MHPAVQGLLAGFVIGAIMIAAEYYFVKKAVEGRATPSNPKPEFEPMDRNRVRAVINFAIFLPPAFAIGFWLWDSMNT